MINPKFYLYIIRVCALKLPVLISSVNSVSHARRDQAAPRDGWNHLQPSTHPPARRVGSGRYLSGPARGPR